MKKIQNFQIDVSEMPAAATTRTFTVNGEKGAEFILYVLENGSIKYYDFTDQSFELGHNNKDNNLKIKLGSTGYTNNIKFPSGGGTYTIKLVASLGTEIQGLNKYVISRSIDKLAADAVVTFQAATTNTSNYATFPTTTSTGAPNASKRFDFDWDIVNVTTGGTADSHGFGLFITDSSVQIEDNFWYFTTTDTVDGAISSSTKVIVDDVTDIVEGMIITGVSSGSLSGEPSILHIDTGAKTLTMSSAQTFADGITLTFKAVGSAAISDAIGLSVEFVQYPTIAGEILTKTIRAGSSGTVINLNGTYGIAGNSIVTYQGFGIDNANDNSVVTVNASSTAGSIEVANDQDSGGDITAGTTLTFNGVFQTINFGGTINITRYPTADRTIYLDIDKIITVGVGSA